MYMHYLDTNIVLLVFVLLKNIDDNIYFLNSTYFSIFFFFIKKKWERKSFFPK